MRLNKFITLQLICGAMYLSILPVSHVGLEAVAVVLGLAFIVQAYAFWLLGLSENDNSRLIAFAREVYRAIPIIFALLGAAALLQALGALTGLDVLEEAGNALGDLFGWI